MLIFEWAGGYLPDAALVSSGFIRTDRPTDAKTACVADAIGVKIFQPRCLRSKSCPIPCFRSVVGSYDPSFSLSLPCILIQQVARTRCSAPAKLGGRLAVRKMAHPLTTFVLNDWHIFACYATVGPHDQSPALLTR